MTSHYQRHPSCHRLWLALLVLVATVFNSNNRGTTSVAAFAAKKKPNQKKKGNSASSQKGFGVAPPTLEEVTAKFKTRLPENNADDLDCPCGIVSGATYGNCCAPYHRQEKAPETPLRVLQSRYSAFCYRLVPYILQTTHPTCRDYRENRVAWAQDLNKSGMFDSFDFVELQAGPEIFEGDDQATIDFQVRLRAKEGDQQETIVAEKSVFLRDPESKVWSYASGEVRSGVEGLEDTILNQ